MVYGNSVNQDTKCQHIKDIIESLKNDLNLLCLLKENKQYIGNNDESLCISKEELKKNQLVVTILNDIIFEFSRHNNDTLEPEIVNRTNSKACNSYIIDRIYSNLYKHKVDTKQNYHSKELFDFQNCEKTKYQYQLLEILQHITKGEQKSLTSCNIFLQNNPEHTTYNAILPESQDNTNLRLKNIIDVNSIYTDILSSDDSIFTKEVNETINSIIHISKDTCDGSKNDRISTISDIISNDNNSIVDSDAIPVNPETYYQTGQTSCTYFEKRQGRLGLHKQSLIQEFISHEARAYSQYVKWIPTQGVLYSAYGDADEVKAIELISLVLSLRNYFIKSNSNKDSIAVFKPPEIRPLGQGSNEPIFDPSCVKPFKKSNAVFQMIQGVYHIYLSKEDNDKDINTLEDIHLFDSCAKIPSISDFLNSLNIVMSIVQNPVCKTYAYRRLQCLKRKFDMHRVYNSATELQETRDNKHRDFYNIRKVDTHVHHSACMQQKHLLRFIRKKYRTEADVIVAKNSKSESVTLKSIFENEIGISAWEASVDSLNVHALGGCFHRFDLFNMKYNPFGQPLLREVFLKTDNLIEGRYLAEITRQVIDDLEERKYEYVEWRVSIYGKDSDEWEKLAIWVKNNSLQSKQVRWMVQIPRLYHVYKKLNLISSFADLLRNIFEPLIKAIQDPESHPDIFYLLLQLNGWDSVDDESIVSKYTTEQSILPDPEHWTYEANPPYSYWAYYMYANIQSINSFLVARGLRSLPYRPHCGEVGNISHLASMYLLANSINHGIMLRKTPVLQYLYYLHQIGLAVSPLSNNALFQDITKNPFNVFFEIGMNVSLSSDDPMIFHYTDEPLLEEYSCSAHIWKLSPVDLCEIARNSVLQSNFEPQLKRHWLGENYDQSGSKGNDILKTNVSNIRLKYREDTLIDEFKYLRDVLSLKLILDECTGNNNVFEYIDN